jgi:hypothetical protein
MGSTAEPKLTITAFDSSIPGTVAVRVRVRCSPDAARAPTLSAR